MPIPNIIALSSSITGMPAPVVGMGATYICGSDCYPYTVTKIVSPKTIEVKPNAHRADKTKEGGMGHQNWVIDEEPNPDATPTTLTLRKNGWWIPQGSPMKGGSIYEVGDRRYYHCWEF